jgi:hypothetical protein
LPGKYKALSLNPNTKNNNKKAKQTNKMHTKNTVLQ